MVLSNDSLVPEFDRCLGTFSVDRARTYNCIFKKITSLSYLSDIVTLLIQMQNSIGFFLAGSWLVCSLTRDQTCASHSGSDLGWPQPATAWSGAWVPSQRLKAPDPSH